MKIVNRLSCYKPNICTALLLCAIATGTIGADATEDLFAIVREGYTSGYGLRITSALSDGANVNALDPDGYTPLHYALNNYFLLSDEGAIDVLLDEGADPNIPIMGGRTLLEVVAEGLLDPIGNRDFFGGAAISLIEAGSNVNEYFLSGSTALIEFSRIGSTRVVKVLLEAGANVNTVNDFGERAWDAADGHVEIIALLERAGASVSADQRRSLAEKPYVLVHWIGQNDDEIDPLVESIIFRGDWRVLTETIDHSDLRAISLSQLRILRNTIFARHGHSFRSQDLRTHYENFDWYEPISSNVNDKLTPTEQANVSLIAEAEKGFGSSDPNESRKMAIPTPDGFLVEFGYASTFERYMFTKDKVTLDGSRATVGRWRMADRFVLIDWDSGHREWMDWLFLQNTESDHVTLRSEF